MKKKSFLLACLIGAASISLSQATQYIYLTGSTAARATVYNTLIAGVGFDASPTFVGYGSGTPSGCTYMNFSNTVSGISTEVKCSWSGSEAGIADTAGTVSEAFLNDAGVGGVAGSGANPATPAGAELVTNTVDLAMADNALAFSKTPGSTALQTEVCTIPFVLVKNFNTVSDQSSLTNISVSGFQKLASGGEKLALYTGNSADTNTYVYLSGRDSFSGTRANVFGDTAYGIKHNPEQIEIDGTSGAMLDPNGDGSYETTEGFSSGGTLAKSLGVDTSAAVDQLNGGNGFVVVAYLGLSDAITAEGLGNPAVQLTYNGVAESAAAVIEGRYELWGNEYVLEKSGASSQAQTLYTKLVSATGIPSKTDGVSTISLSAMHATRTGPTTPPAHR
jgi:hypothetical protein